MLLLCPEEYKFILFQIKEKLEKGNFILIFYLKCMNFIVYKDPRGHQELY